MSTAMNHDPAFGTALTGTSLRSTLPRRPKAAPGFRPTQRPADALGRGNGEACKGLTNQEDQGFYAAPRARGPS